MYNINIQIKIDFSPCDTATDTEVDFKHPKTGIVFNHIPTGSFMNVAVCNDSGYTVRKVHVPEFHIGRYPVTNEEYGRFMKVNPGTDEPKYWGDRKYNQSRQPVVGVSWHDAVRYAQWAGLQLPSEAQWEYACRAGTDTLYYTGNSEEDLDRAGWYNENSGGKLHPVGEKEPNAFGLYDMHGNVDEWIEDDWHTNYSGVPNDGSAWTADPRGDGRVFRGGAWRYPAGGCRAAFRGGYVPGDRSRSLGFRLVLPEEV